MEILIAIGCVFSFWALVFGIDTNIRLDKIERQLHTDKHEKI